MGPAVADGTTVSMRNGIANRRPSPEKTGGAIVTVERQEEASKTSTEKW